MTLTVENRAILLARKMLPVKWAF